MRLLVISLLLLGSCHALFAKERKSVLGIHSRSADGDDDIFPFPANESSGAPSSPPPPDMNDTVPTGGSGGPIPRIFIEKGCDEDRKIMISNAWPEARELALAQTTFKKGYNYDIPHSQWLGPDWNSRGSWIPWRQNFRQKIGDNFRRLRQMFSTNAQTGEYIYWYCNDHGGHCREDVVAYTWDEIGTFFWSNHNTVFCEEFYLSETLSEQLERWEDDKTEQKIMENFQLSRGHTMFHETWHYERLVSYPHVYDKAYQAEATWNLSLKEGTDSAYVNADSYSFDALAIYVQRYYGSDISPIPYYEYVRRYPDDDVSKPEVKDVTALTFDKTPPGWNGPLVTDDKPDLSIWEELHFDALPSPDSSSSPSPSPSPAPPPPPPPPDQNACHGINGDYWVMSRDLAIENVKDFCGQSDKTKEHNGDTVNDLLLSVKKLDDDSKGPKEAPDCFGRFQRSVIDGCDGGDYLKNPFNYKFGSTLTTGDGWEYKMEPLSQQVNAVNCDVSYKFAFDAVEIRGKNFPDAKLGVNGEGLHHELSGCGALTKWHFERTPDNCCFQWFASAQLPIGTKACVGRAVMSAGGSDDGNCRGAWKAAGNVSNIDSWPGYGYEGRHVFSDGSI